MPHSTQTCIGAASPRNSIHRACALARRLRAAFGLAALGALALVQSCAGPVLQPDRTDITAEAAASATLRPKPLASNEVPDLVESTPAPRPRDTPRLERYSVVVSDVEIRDLLFAVARDAKVNVDVDPRIHGRVSINAIE